MSDEYAKQIGIATNFMSSFIDYHEEKIQNMINTVSIYLDDVSSVQLNKEFGKFISQSEKLFIDPENIPNSYDEIQERESEIFHEIIPEFFNIVNNVIAAFISNSNYSNIPDHYNDADRFAMLIIKLRKIPKNERCSRSKLIIQNLEINGNCIKHACLRKSLFIPYHDVFLMIKQLRNKETHRSEPRSMSQLRKLNKPLEGNRFILDPITKGYSFGNTFSTIGSFIMLTYYIVEILQTWIDTFDMNEHG